jgi:hydrogenase-4 transcriptional activator
MDRVSLVTRSDVPVLLLGETGSGKEVIARSIHERSSRARGPFLRVNCGAIPPELIDAELFGHEKGSFTGATATRRGWFERADEGTLFLDEIGELPLAAQVRLLRVLQDGSFERVGGEHSVKVDVRMIAATHRDLAGMVQHGTFREDLWYRVAVFPIVLPPLRERYEDIPLLAEHFARRAAVRFGLKLQLPTSEDCALLASYPWPGNVRELSAVIDRAALLGDGERLEVARALGVGSGIPASPTPTNLLHATATTSTPPILPLDEAMTRHIEQALAVTQGRVEGPHGVATLLKINPHTLRARMRKLGINWARFSVRSVGFNKDAIE